MEAKAIKYQVFLIVLCSATAVFAGVINGLLGTGGGIILTFLFSYVFKSYGHSAKDNLVSAMAVVLPVSVFSLTTYEAGYLSSTSDLLAVVIPSAVGGLAGAWLSNRLKPVILEKIFALIVIYAGITMIF